MDVGTRDMPIMLPPEIATVLPGQAYGNKLMDEQTAHMITYACRNPKENAGFIVGEGLTSLGLNPPTPHLVSALFLFLFLFSRFLTFKRAHLTSKCRRK